MSSSHLSSDLQHITETIDDDVGMPQPNLGNAPSLERHHSIPKMSEDHPLAPGQNPRGGGDPRPTTVPSATSPNTNRVVAFEGDYVVKCLPTSDNDEGVGTLVGELDGGISDMISRISRCVSRCPALHFS